MLQMPPTFPSDSRPCRSSDSLAPGEGPDAAPVLQEHKSGHGHNPEAPRAGWAGVHVELDEDHVKVFLGEGVDSGTNGPTGSAPVRIAVYDHQPVRPGLRQRLAVRRVRAAVNHRPRGFQPRRRRRGQPPGWRRHVVVVAVTVR